MDRSFLLGIARRARGLTRVTGESHYVWGIRRRLKVIERPGRAHIEVDGDRLVLYAPVDSSVDDRRLVLDRWYRLQLRQAIPDLIAAWEA